MTKYSDDYKYEILQRMMPPNEEAVLEISNETGIPEQTLYKWKRLAKAKGLVLPGKKTIQKSGVLRINFQLYLKLLLYLK